MSIATDTLLADFLRLNDELKESEAKTKALRAELESIESLLVEQWAAIGQQSVKIDGRLVYRQRELHVSVPAAEREAVVEVFESLGLGELVETNVPTGKLKSWIREQLGEGADELDAEQGFASIEERIPEGLRGRVKVFESYGLRIRKA